MGHVVLRTQKLKSGIAVRRSLAHAFRERDTPNADASLTPENTHIGAAGVDEALAKFNERLATQEKIRKNGVLAIEYLITGSPEDLQGKTRQQQDAYFADAMTWLKDKHGAENVIYAGIHRDESTPHLYAYVVPLDDKGKLNCRSFLGGAKALSQIQTDFADKVGQQHGLERGIEGSKARHTSISKYYARANAAFEPLPEVTTPMPKLRAEPEKPGLFARSEVKTSYAIDHAKWERENNAAWLQKEKRLAEARIQRNTAVEVALRNQAQAKEASALKVEVQGLKKSNGIYSKNQKTLEASVAKYRATAELFTPDEVRAAQMRKREWEREKARQAALGKAAADEAARVVLKARKEAQRVAGIAAEASYRVRGVQALLKRPGVEFTFAVVAATALRESGENPAKVDWAEVEEATIMKAMLKNGQSAESVTNALSQCSPLRADPASHAALQRQMQRRGPLLEAEYQRLKLAKNTGKYLGR